MLLIMGTATQAIGWPDALIEVLLAHGRQVIRFDHRDTGRSDCVDIAVRPYTLDDMAGDAVAVLDGHGVPAAHVVGASLGGAIGQWLAVHHPSRVRTLTAIMTGPMGHDAGPAWARAMSGQAPDPDDLPPPTPQLLRHFARQAATPPPATREAQIAAAVETWRILNGRVLDFDEAAARDFAEASFERATNPAAATHHDLAGRQMTEARRAPLSSITAPTLVIHGTEDPLRPLPHGSALAATVPRARLHTIPGMGHSFYAPGLPHHIGEHIATHTTPR